MKAIIGVWLMAFGARVMTAGWAMATGADQKAAKAAAVKVMGRLANIQQSEKLSEREVLQRMWQAKLRGEEWP